ncbi:MAG: hypothetical protein IPJ79_18770 [Bacteroidetes bacterium]|nr:hypothetical protein [Bacteroidota bacterium]
MVHGLWGGITTFQTMENSLDNSGYYPDELTTRVNYSSSNGAYFYDNRFILPTEINSLLAITRAYGYSAGKVDVIAHSMGGLISRYYLQSAAYQQKEDIHKLITINSPHSGSPCGNLLMNPSSNVSAAARPVAELIAQQYFNSSIYNGAIGDLAINSFAMNYLNSSTLNNGVVPSHTIITETPVGNDNLWYLILSAAAPVVPMTINSFFNYLYYGESNDLVVSSSSQSGGLSPNNTTVFPNQFHIGSSANPFVLTEVQNALNINSANTNYFSNAGFAPVAISSHYKIQSQQQSSSQILTGSISINYPLSGQSFNQGDIIPFNITSANGILRIILEGINLENNSDLVDSTMSNGTINYQVPNNGIGVMKFIALGYDTIGLIDYDTISININQTANIIGLSSYNDTIYIQVNNFASVSVNASFSNGYNYPLDFFSGVLYQIADTNLAKYHSQNLIKGKSIGITNLSVSYMGQNLNIPIVIIPQDTTIIITTSVAQESVVNSNDDYFTVFPNPTQEFISINGKKLTDNVYSFSISNSIGQSIYKQSIKTVGASLERKIDLKKLTKRNLFLQISSDKTKKYLKL